MDHEPWRSTQHDIFFEDYAMLSVILCRYRRNIEIQQSGPSLLAPVVFSRFLFACPFAKLGNSFVLQQLINTAIVERQFHVCVGPVYGGVALPANIACVVKNFAYNGLVTRQQEPAASLIPIGITQNFFQAMA
mmetsp:Transcript_5309/g.11110  ORF Transcript_5309/g.11110 Transcript_5309/m.11110 type:complete len:133 (+) Transcript_5309:1385-1783(+)